MRFFAFLLVLLPVVGWAGPKDDIKAFRQICRLVGDHLSGNFGELDVLTRKFQEEERDALQRALKMKTHPQFGPLSTAIGSVKDRNGAYDVEYGGNPWTELVAVNDPTLSTVRFQSDRGLILPESRLVVPWGHGWTGIRSHSGGVLGQVNYMMTRTNRAQDVKHYFKTSSMAVDYPHHGAGPRGPEFMEYREMLKWRHQYFTFLKEQSGGLPIVPGTRSAENLPIAQLNLMYPGLFKAMIFMSPMHPIDGTTEGLQGYHHFNTTTDNILYPKAFEMLQNIVAELRTRKDSWANVEHPFGDPPTPTLILVGSEDVETSQGTRNKFKQYARRYPGVVHYVEVKGAGHNVFEAKSQEDKVRFKQAWNYVYWFLKRHGLEESADVPPYGLLLNEGQGWR